MPLTGRTARLRPLWVLCALAGLCLSFVGAETEFRVFQVHASMAGEADDPARGPDYYLSGGADDGLRVGQRLEVYRDEVAIDPITKTEHSVRLPVGELVLISVDATAAIARRAKIVSFNRAPLLRHHAVMVGDVALPMKEPDVAAPGENPTDPVVATPVSAALAIELPSSILFDLDSAVLKAVQANFAGVEEALKRYPDHHLIVEGHTCDLGGRGHNDKLSLARARSVAAYLAQRFDVASNRMTVVSYGSDRPVERSPKKRARNRRVEIRFVTQPENVARAFPVAR